MFIIITAVLIKIFSQDKMLFTIIFVTFLSQGIWFFPIVTPFYFIWYKKKSSIDNINEIQCQRKAMKIQEEGGVV